MRHNTSRTLADIDTFDLVLEKRGRQTDITPEQREATAAYADSQGYAGTARKLRELNARRYGWDRPALRAVPDDRRRPLASGEDRPLLRALDGQAEREFDPDRSWWLDVRRICAKHDPAYLSLPGRLAIDALRRGAGRHLG